MKDLIEALTIFLKYADEKWPTKCSNDTLAIVGITREQVSAKDHARLDALGFFWSDDGEGCYMSFRYGSD